MTAVYRHEVPVDDGWHELHTGQILHVASRHIDTVEVWALSDDPTFRKFRVFGTGQPDVTGTYVGTAIVPGGALVWHLFEWTPSVITVKVCDLRRGDVITTNNGPDWPYGAEVDHVRQLGSEYGNVWDRNGHTLIERIPLDATVKVRRS